MSETILNDYSASLTASYVSQSHYTDDSIEALCVAVNALRNEVRDLMVNKAVESLQVPLEFIEPAVNEYVKKTYKLGRPPMEGEVLDAITKTKTMRQAAGYLGIAPSTLKRYAVLYENNHCGGVPLSLWRPTRGTKSIHKSTLP